MVKVRIGSRIMFKDILSVILYHMESEKGLLLGFQNLV
jgi:hypothetical protein